MDGNYCEPCGLRDPEPGHLASVEHIYNFHVWEWNNYRKALAKDRHGITIDIIEEEKKVKIDRNFQKERGTYTFTILTEQFLLNRRQITFTCNVKNGSRSNQVYITNADILHDDLNFKFKNPFRVVGEPDKILCLEPGGKCSFNIIYSLNEVVNLTHKIPVAFSFQVENELKDTFTIARSIVIKISDNTEVQLSPIKGQEQKKKSPFTKQIWTNIGLIIDSIRKTNPLNNFPIPKRYDRIIKMGLNDRPYFTEEEYKDCLKLKQLAELGVNYNNYRDYWQLLLWLDECGEALKIQCYNMEKVTMEEKGGLLVLQIPGLAEKRPSLLVGDLIEIRITADHTAYRGVIERVNANDIYIKWVNEMLVTWIKKQPDLELDVRFQLQRLPSERMHSGIKRGVIKNTIKNLFPSADKLNLRIRYPYGENDIEFVNPYIEHNHEQRTAVLNILNGTSQSAPYIVFGPPGTGKTVTIVEAILQLKKKTSKKILVCAPSNAACDMITIKLIPHCQKSELIRMNSDTRDHDGMSQKLLEYSNFGEGGFCKMTADEANKYRIVVATLIHIGKFDQSTSFKPDCLFIDEAAQASEPETYVAIGFLTNGKLLVLAGDHKQLGPVVCSKIAEEYGLGVSLLQRLVLKNDLYARDDPNFITMLKLNFRSHEHILRIPNGLFYDNQLQPRAQYPPRDPLVKLAIYPLILQSGKSKRKQGSALEFCGIISKEKKEGNSPSFFNMDETFMVIKYVRAFLQRTNFVEDHRVTQEQIGIITPYIRQVHKIKYGLKRNGFDQVEVGTTETFQGREKRIIIISTVRAQRSLMQHDRKFNLGFVRNDKRFNVCITRAKSKLVVIGCPAVLETDTKWALFMETCEQHETYFGAPYQKRTSDFKANVVNRLKNTHVKDSQYNRNNNNN